jgi:hypothetical protein
MNLVTFPPIFIRDFKPASSMLRNISYVIYIILIKACFGSYYGQGRIANLLYLHLLHSMIPRAAMLKNIDIPAEIKTSHGQK